MARMSSVMRASSRPALHLTGLVAVATLAGCASKTPPATAPTATASVGTAAAATRLEPPLASADRGVLATALDPLFGAPGLRTAVWSVLIQSLDTGEVLYRLNPDTLVMPASNQKIVSTAVAAARLGWDYRFETRLETTGTVAGGALQGDLFVTGTGDPSINDRDGRREVFFDEMAAALRAAGISRVQGRLIGDDNAFDEERFGYGWSWDDFVFGYSAPVGALQVNENLAHLVVSPGAGPGEAARVTLREPGSDLVLISHVTTGARDSETRVSMDRMPGKHELTVTGSIAAGNKDIVREAAVDNPTTYFLGQMRAALAARGITVSGGDVDVDDLDGTTRTATRQAIGRLQSPPLSDIARPLMKVSQNLYAETAMRALSLGAAPASMDASRKAVEETLGRWGVPAGTYVVADGSGLSRYNYVNASMIVAILRAIARDQKLAGPFVATLPIAGQDGTIGSRMKGTRAEGNVKAKTGSISNVRSLSGYLTTAAGERVVFSAIANNFTTPYATVDAAVEAALERVISTGPRAR